MSKLDVLLFDILEAYEAWETGEAEPKVEVGDRSIPISKACGLLWSRREWMPNRLRQDVLHLIRYGEKNHTLNTLATYAQAARIVKRRIDEALH